MKITLDHIEELQERATAFARASSYHGPRHWRDVARLGMALSSEGVDAHVLLLFAAANGCHGGASDHYRFSSGAAVSGAAACREVACGKIRARR